MTRTVRTCRRWRFAAAPLVAVMAALAAPPASPLLPAHADGPRTGTMFPSLWHVSCAGAGVCVAAGDLGILLVSADGGATWTPQDNGMPNGDVYASLYAVSCASASTCAVSGATLGLVLRTTDGGHTWTPQQADDPSSITNIYALSCRGSASCIGVGSGNYVVRTANGGRSWSDRSAYASAGNVVAVDCVTATHCTAAGDAGVLLTTVDGGATWVRTLLPQVLQMNGVSCPSLTTCFAVGGSGLIVASRDGGRRWAALRSGTENDLDGISCPDARTCYAVGERSTIVRTDDGGVTWRQQASALAPAQAVAATPADACSGGFLATVADECPTLPPALHSVSCSDTSHCVAVGAEGTIETTADGGATWTPPSMTARSAGSRIDRRAPAVMEIAAGVVRGSGGPLFRQPARLLRRM